MPTTISLKNFNKENTPDGLKKWADIILKVAAAGIIIGGTLAAPPLGLAIGSQIVMYSGVAGTMFKAISKLFGVKSDE